MISQEIILHKINSLSPQKIVEVVDFIDFLAERENSEKKAKNFSTIAEYAMANGGTEYDLDSHLEQAGIENLLTVDEAKF